MKKHNLVQLQLGVALMAASQVALTQSQSELDITMRVIEEGQMPAGFIQQLELPPPEFFIRQDQLLNANADITIAEEVQSDTDGLVEEVTEIASDGVRVSISIDGTAQGTGAGQGTPNPVAELPRDVINVLNPSLPLTNTLQDTLNQVTNPVNNVGASVLNITRGSTDAIVDTTVDATVDISVGNAGGDLVNEVQNTAIDVSNSLNVEIDAIVDVLDDSVSDDLSNEVDQVVNDSVNDVLNNNNVLPELEVDVVEDISSSIDATLRGL